MILTETTNVLQWHIDRQQEQERQLSVSIEPTHLGRQQVQIIRLEPEAKA